MKAFKNLIKSIQNISPEIEIKLNKPASKSDFNKLINVLDVKTLPKEFVDLYSLCNGQDSGTSGLIGHWELIEIKFIVKEIQLMKELNQKNVFKNASTIKSKFVTNTWWDEKWIPFVSSGSGHYYCIDLNPNTKGTFGQVLLFIHDDDLRPLIAKNLNEWFERITEDINKGVYKYKDGNYNNEAFVKSSIEAKKLYK